MVEPAGMLTGVGSVARQSGAVAVAAGWAAAAVTWGEG